MNNKKYANLLNKIKMKGHMAKAVALAMCFVLFTTSVDITAFAFTGGVDSDKNIVRIGSLSDEIAHQKVGTDATLEDVKFPESLDVHVTYQAEKEIDVEVEKEEQATPTPTSTPTPSAEPTPTVEPTPSAEVVPTETLQGEDDNTPEETNEENQGSDTPEQDVPANEPVEESNQSNDTKNENTESQPDGEQVAKITYGEYDSVETVYVPMTYYAAEPSKEEVVVETLEKSDVADMSDDKKTESKTEIKKETVIEKVEEDDTVSVTWVIDEENSSKAEFKELEAGEKYVFVPTITEDGYKLADDVDLPVITVNVEDNISAFEQSVTVDDVVITVTADDGVFPEGATIEARKVTESEESEVTEAIDEVRSEEKNVAVSYTFDITIYDKDGNEIEPDTSKGSVKVTFKMAEIANENLETDVYHVEETDDGLNAEGLAVTNKGANTDDANIDGTNTDGGDASGSANDEITVETTGFSFYTVEFTYGELQYVLEGDERVELTTILDAVGIKENGEISKAEGSDDELFKPVFEDDVWYIEALKAFNTEEWLKVTIDGIEYEIVVTDDQEVTTWADLQTALSGENGTITLGADIKAISDSATLEVSGTKTLDLNGHVINGTRDDSTSVGSVIKVLTGAFLTLNDGSTGKEGKITGGTGFLSASEYLGGGVYVVNGGRFVMNGGTISDCSATKGGGVFTWGDFTMNNSSAIVECNASVDGGGVCACNCSVTMNDSSKVSKCTAGNGAGGVYFFGNSSMTVSFNINDNSTISECTANANMSGNQRSGGGVCVEGNSCMFTMNGGSITGGNTLRGGGVHVFSGFFTMKGGSITGNTSTNDGGGVYVDNGGKFIMEGGTISTNTANANGGGVFVNKANFDMSGGTISSNTGIYGGGVCGLCDTNPKTEFILSGGEISGNTANYGGGVHLNGVTFVMSNGTISENTANYGGGVHLHNGVTCTMNGGTISNNTAKMNNTDAGGGIYVDSSSFTMNNGSISNNKASGGHGGGIFITSGSTFTLGDGEIAGNSALSWAGGVCNKGTFIMNGGAIFNNQAISNSGGGVSSSGTVTMTGGSINGNTAEVNGGGFYNGGILTLGGAAQITGNVIGGEIKNGALTGGTANNVYHENGKTISIVEGDKKPTESMNIGITLQCGTGNVTATNSDTGEYAKYFTADDENYSVVKGVTDKNIKIINASEKIAVVVETGVTYVSVQEAVTDAVNGQTVQMLKDSTENVTVNKDIKLDLNGMVLKGTGTGSVITIKDNAFLNLVDSNKSSAHTGTFEGLPAGGIITGGGNTHGGGVSILCGTFTMNAGTICKNTATNSGGGVCVGKSDNNDQSVVESHFIMNGGTISDNEGTSWGGGVCVGPGENKKADFVMNGGTVTKNKSKDGGGVHVGGPGSYSVFTMVDGTISENVVSNGGGGGGISLYFYRGGSNYAFNMLGGTVSNNTTSSGVGGGVKVFSSGEGTRDIAFGGDAKIIGNKNGSTDENLYLPNEVIVKIGTTLPKTGMSIGVTTQTKPTVGNDINITGTNGSDYSSYFTSDNPAYSVKNDSNVIKLIKNVSTVTTAPQAKELLKYNATEQALVSAGAADGGTMNYVIGENDTTAPTSDWNTSIPTGKNAGTYYVWYKSVGDSEHSDSEPVCVTVTLAKANHTVTAPTALNPTYNGSAQGLISAGSCTTGTIKYSLDGTTYYDSVDLIKKAEVGSYTVYYKVEGNGNYETYGPKTIKANIVKEPDPTPTPTPKPDPKPTPSPSEPDPQPNPQPTIPVTSIIQYAETGNPIKNYVANNPTGSNIPLPYITTDGSKAGWKTIDEALDAHKAKYKKNAVGTLSITMNGSTTVDTKLITDAHEKKIPLSFALDDEVAIGIPVANTVLSDQAKEGKTTYFKVSSMTTAEAVSVKKAHAGLLPSDIVAIGGDANTPVVLTLCSNDKLSTKKSQLMTITFNAKKAGFKKGDKVYLYCGTSQIGISMYKTGKVDKNGFVTFSVPMVSNYWTIGSKNMKNKLLRNNVALPR